MLNSTFQKAIKDSKSHNDSVAYLAEVKKFIYVPDISSDMADQLCSYWDRYTSFSKNILQNYVKGYTSEQFLEYLTEASDLELVECKGVGGRRSGNENMGRGIYPKKLSIDISGSFYNIRTVYATRNFTFDTATQKWKKAGTQLGAIYGYDTNPLNLLDFKAMPHEKAGQFEPSVTYYGVELEVNCKTENKVDSVAKLVHKDLKTDFVMLKSDSSIGQNGFEIVTAPATLAYHKTAWDNFFNGSAKLVQSWNVASCGMHVHINREAFTSPNHLGKMMAFYNAPCNKAFIERVAGRASEYAKMNPTHNPFVAKALKREEGTSTGDAPLNSFFKGFKDRYDRRSAVNINNPDTVEIRIFKGNTSKVGFFKNLEFVDSLVEYSKVLRYNAMSAVEKAMHEKRLKVGSNGQEMNIYGLSFADYITWLKKDKSNNYMNLKLWMAKNGLLDGFKAKKYTTLTPKDKVITDEQINAVA